MAGSRFTCGEGGALGTLNKDIEIRALLAARRAGFSIPSGEVIPGEEPDFRIETETGTLGIELAEVLPPPRNDSFSSPVAEEDLHQSVIEIAEKNYCIAGGQPVKVSAFFWEVERARNKKHDMADGLVEFVRSNCARANPVFMTDRRDKLPHGFSAVSIDSHPGPWWSGECVGNTLEGIYRQLATRIAAKNKLLPTYRANLPNSSIWLLLYSCSGVSRGVEMPHGISEWSFLFEFDRVFFFASLSGSVAEIRRAAFGLKSQCSD